MRPSGRLLSLVQSDDRWDANNNKSSSVTRRSLSSSTRRRSSSARSCDLQRRRRKSLIVVLLLALLAVMFPLTAAAHSAAAAAAPARRNFLWGVGRHRRRYLSTFKVGQDHPSIPELLSPRGGGGGGSTTRRAISAFAAASSSIRSERERIARQKNDLIPQQQTRLYVTSPRKQQPHAGGGKDAAAFFSPYDNDNDNEYDEEDVNTMSYYRRPMVQWYPGHIAKAERLLKETFLKAVDVVVEVRDARAAQATSHPNVPLWCGNNQNQNNNNNNNIKSGKPRLVVLTHVDQIPAASLRAWKTAYENLGMDLHHFDDDDSMTTLSEEDIDSNKQQAKKNPRVFFVNAKVGLGIHSLVRAIVREGAPVQERRHKRGLLGRPLRVGVIGYPNVGKSALLNRLVLVGSSGRRKKRARTANTPGVTRTLQWIRVRTDRPSASGSSRPVHEQSSDGSSTAMSSTNNKDFELLDSPGIIPASLTNQADAALLAACNCIGNAAYDNQLIAAFLCEWMLNLQRSGQASLAAPAWANKCQSRYRLDVMTGAPVINANSNHDELTGEDMLHHVADETCQGDLEDASRKILQDFRAGRMGPICLQPPAVTGTSSTSSSSSTADKNGGDGRSSNSSRSRSAAALEMLEMERQERAKVAMETAKQRGLELPPMIQQEQQQQLQQTEEAAATENATRTSEDDGSKASTAKTVVVNQDEVGKGLFDGW